MIADLANAMRQQQSDDLTGPRTGTITSYDPANGVVKVAIQPEGRETNWMPLDCPGVGNGWGVQIGPQIGDEVTVSFDSSDANLGKVICRHTNSQSLPMPVPSGEIWMVHQSGALLKFNTDGTVSLHSEVAINYDAPAHHFTGGPVTMDHTLTVTDSTGIVVTGGDVKADTISLKLHKTSQVQFGTGTSGVPVP
ncbi:phage baseplate assembly protein V [Pseudomonas sp. 14P_8.1_Bac3]|uniref:phage baseplate assembly protein V n=1 Tax=Pseudomonas sp. 14P_8.1_Bac3 TaxID=2971621 RepID=UPI0021C81B7E|nr:phage baseplate assembly protein V [Pseudomonas sp. 14P_8.1_Bac3]MCU1758701.1 phage baseplate assembly protein V [Pseudomonas sp. 14P_8.1_Bac3]